jgi:hypothetical protein
MSFEAPRLAPAARPICSLVAIAQRAPAEVASFPCVDPVETAADKLSALTWRVLARDRSSAKDDPTIIRDLHDLAALEHHVAAAPRFAELALAAAAADVERGAGSTGDAAADFAAMLQRLQTDPLWTTEYEEFVRQVSFAGAGEEIGFAAALAGCSRLALVVSPNHHY